MICSSFPSIVLRPDGSCSCFPSRRWGKPRVGTERRSGDLGVRPLTPDSLLNPFRNPERLPPKALLLSVSPSSLGPRAPAGRLRLESGGTPGSSAASRQSSAMSASFHEGADEHKPCFAPRSPPGWGCAQTREQDAFSLGYRNLLLPSLGEEFTLHLCLLVRH